MQNEKQHPFLEQLEQMPAEIKEKLLNDYINPVSEQIASQNEHSSLESPQVAQERTKLQMLDNLQNYQTTMSSAANILKTHDEFPNIDLEKLQIIMSEDEDTMTMPDLENPEDFIQQLQDKESLKEKLGLKTEELDKVYARADTLLRENNIQDAEAVAQFLLMFDSKNSMYWVAYGITLLRQEKIEEAKQAFSMSVVLNNQNAWAFYYLAETLIAANEKDQAREVLQELIPELVKVKELSELLEMAKQLQSSIQEFKKV